MNKGKNPFLIGCLAVIGVIVLFVIIIALNAVSTYNRLVRLEESVNQTWAQVENQLQRRYDLIPNLVETVKGYASHERETLEAVTQARANATRPNISTEQLLSSPDQMQRFMQAQDQLSQALARLLVVVERYPDLKANQNFIRLQDELAGTENRIAVERRRFNQAVQSFNQKIRSFPTVLFAGTLGFQKKVYFEAPEAAQQAPRVDFSSEKGTTK